MADGIRGVQLCFLAWLCCKLPRCLTLSNRCQFSHHWSLLLHAMQILCIKTAIRTQWLGCICLMILLYLVEGEGLEVKVISLALWACVGNLNSDRSGICIGVAIALQRESCVYYAVTLRPAIDISCPKIISVLSSVRILLQSFMSIMLSMQFLLDLLGTALQYDRVMIRQRKKNNVLVLASAWTTSLYHGYASKMFGVSPAIAVRSERTVFQSTPCRIP